MKALMTALGVLSAMALPAVAQEAGSIGCAQDFGMVKQYLMDNRSRLSDSVIRDAESRLDVAAGQCKSSTSIAQTNLAQLRKELGMEAMDTQPMTATMPPARR